MKYSTYQEYFKNLCIKHKVILHTDDEKHFVRDMWEFINGNRSDIFYPCVILDSYEKSFEKKDSDNIRDTNIGAFTIFQKVESGDFNAQNAAIDLCEEVARDFISAIRKDARNTYENTFPVEYFDESSVKIFTVGPFDGNAYGVRVEFSFANQADLSYKPLNWNS